MTEAQEAEKQTGRPTGAIYGQDSDMMYASDMFQEDSNAGEIDNSDEMESEGNP